jgi:acetyltransferase-like isoleucine patch superfamily enzyme
MPTASVKSKSGKGAALRLQVAKITIGPHAFVGARAFILPGVVVGERAIVGAGAVVTRDVAPSMIVAGNPAREIIRPGLENPFHLVFFFPERGRY